MFKLSPKTGKCQAWEEMGESIDLGLGKSIHKGPVVGKSLHVRRLVWMEQACKQESN